MFITKEVVLQKGQGTKYNITARYNCIQLYKIYSVKYSYNPTYFGIFLPYLEMFNP